MELKLCSMVQCKNLRSIPTQEIGMIEIKVHARANEQCDSDVLGE